MAELPTSNASLSRGEVPLPPTQLWIGGQWREGGTDDRLPTYDPTLDEEIAQLSVATAADVDRAVGAARFQFDEGPWSKTTVGDRAAMLLRLADLIERDATILHALERLEVGQPGFPPNGEFYRYYAGWADKLDGRVVSVPPRGPQQFHSFTTREPIGVVVAISPWNGPTLENARKLAPLLAAGCTVVVKPPEDAGLSTLHLAGLIDEAGFPAGVVNVVPGYGKDTGAALVAHPGVDGIAFTGSAATGREILRAGAGNFKRTLLEMGGKSAIIVFEDADLDQAVPTAVRSFTVHGGQVCAAGTRMLVQRSMLEEFSARLVDGARRVRIGDPFVAGTEMGPMVSKAHLQRILNYIDSGRLEGGQVLTGGQTPDGPGSFLEPTAFAGTNNLTLAREEIFGPVTVLIPFDTEQEAIALANDTPYGLAGYVWTRDLARALRVSRRLTVGSVWVNSTGFPDVRMPWGGRKSSGIGREQGPNGIENWLEEKAVTIPI